MKVPVGKHVTIEKPKRKNFEEYRKYRYCPVPGCPRRGPHRKLPNHLTTFHEMQTAEERLQFLKRAVVATNRPRKGPRQVPAPTQPTIKAAMQAVSQKQDAEEEGEVGQRGLEETGGAEASGEDFGERNKVNDEQICGMGEGGESILRKRKRKHKQSKVGRPVDVRQKGPNTSKSRKGKEKAKVSTKKADTRHYPSYPLTHPFLARYKKSLTTQSEGARTEAVAVAMGVDLSKFLYFAGAKDDGGEDGPGELEPKHLSDVAMIDQYLQKLEEDGIEASGQLTKVQRLSTALEYALYRLGWYKVPALKARSDAALYFLRKKAQTLQGLKSARARKTLRDKSLSLRNPDAIEEVSKFLKDPLALLHAEQAMAAGENITPEQYKDALCFLAGTLYYRSLQRKQAVESMTIAEFEKGTWEEIDDEHLFVVQVHRHKTAKSMGAAQVVMDAATQARMLKFIAIRKRVKSEVPYVFVRFDGSRPAKLTELVKAHVGKKYGARLPNPTVHRSALATKACELPEGDQERVAKLMCHSLQTHRRYYRAIESTRDVAKAFKVVGPLMEPPHEKTTAMPSKRYMSTQDVEIIRSYFGTYINSGKTPSLPVCAQFLEVHSMPGYNPKNIQDKIRNIVKKTAKQ